MEVEIEPKDAAWLAEELEVLYVGQNHKPDDLDGNELGNEFYRGGQISWYELQLGNIDVQRDLAHKIETRLHEHIGNHKSAKLTLYHAPGGGGSTLARRIIWNLHLNKIDACVCVFVINLSLETSQKIVWLHKKTHLPVLVVDDCRLWKAESLYIEQLFLFCHRATQLVILDVQRFSSRIETDSKGDSFWLRGEVSDDEAIRLKRAFAHNCPTREKQLQKLVKDVKSGRPHHVCEFGLAAYEYDFKGVQSYVSGYLKYDSSGDMLPWQQVVSFLALAYYYGHAQIPGQFFARILHIDDRDVVDYDDLPYEAKKVVCTDELNNWRITLHVIAKEILEQVLRPQQHRRELGIRLSKDARNHLEKLALSFVKEAGAQKSSGDRVSHDIVQIIRATFFQRHNNEILLAGQKKHLSPILLDIPSKHPYTERLNILKLLAESFPRNPHCLAHLGRFYAYERSEFELAKENVEKALQICQEEFSKHHHHSTNDDFRGSQDFNEMDSPYDNNLLRIYNMKGCVYLAEMSKLVGRLGSVTTYERSIDIEAMITEALSLARIASDAFVKCREYYRKGYEQEIGYVPDIQLRLILLEFIQKNHYGGYRQYIGSKNADIFIEEALGTIDTLICECQDKVPTLTNAFYNCVDWFYVLFKDAASAINDWHDISTVRGRRGKIAAYRMKHYKKDVAATRSVQYWDEVNQKADIVDIIALHEQNVDEVFEHGLDYSIEADMKDWLLAIRHELIDEPYSVEEVLRRVRQWYERAKSSHSIYYMYVLTTILALGIGPYSGSRESFAEVNRLKPQLKNAAARVSRPKICREWLGSSQKGIQCLVHSHCLSDWDHETRFWRYKEKYTLLTMRTGTIRKADNETIGTIEMDTGKIRGIDGILVVFVPIVSGFYGRRFVNTRVEFFLGFSFAHGCEAFNVTELKRYQCSNCGSKVEISMLGKQVVYCECGYPVTRRNKAALMLGSTEEDVG
ncbi:uncharacterized protein [Branchiostoma lanceolatum]|uniref:uncharacterized protein n=1 Tax=Branchiostoma lanceolatum TaxID=7740 RepID=UPI003456D8E7